MKGASYGSSQMVCLPVHIQEGTVQQGMGTLSSLYACKLSVIMNYLTAYLLQCLPLLLTVCLQLLIVWSVL